MMHFPWRISSTSQHVGYTLILCTFGFSISLAVPCQELTIIGATDLNAYQLGNNKSWAGVLMAGGPQWTAPCCGSVAAWEAKVFTPGLLEFHVWNIFDPASRTASLYDYNQVMAYAPGIVRTDVRNVSERILIRPPFAIGWLSAPSDIVYHSEGCSSCTTEFWEEDFSVKDRPDTYYPSYMPLDNWGPHTFSASGSSLGVSRDYAIRAYIEPTAVPYFINLPSITMLLSHDSVGAFLYFIDYGDDNLYDELEVTLIETNPMTSMFSVHPIAGLVRLAEDRPPSPAPEYILTMQVTDGCSASQSQLVVKVRPTPNKGVCIANEEYGSLDIEANTEINSDTRTAVVVADPLWEIDCCGVVVAWELRVAMEGNIELQVWEEVDINNNEFSMTGFTMHHVVPAANGGIVHIDVPVADQVPVRQGNFIGWLSHANHDMVYHRDDCHYCMEEYFFEVVPTMGRPMMYNPGLTHYFDTNGYGISTMRDYAIKAIVLQGSAPGFKNVPGEAIVLMDAAPGSSFYQVIMEDPNLKDVLSVQLLATNPDKNAFDLDPNTGALSVATAFDPTVTLYTLTVEVTDGCLSTQADLTVNVRTPPLGGECLPQTKYGSQILSERTEIDTSKTAMVMLDPYWKFDCCGVVSAWEVKVAAEGDLDLQVWEVTDAAGRKAILRGSYSYHAMANMGEIQHIALAESEHIPINAGYTIGWLHSNLLYYSEGCATCTQQYLKETLTIAWPPDDYGLNLEHTFTTTGSGLDGKEYAVRAIVSEGATPMFTNLPEHAWMDPNATSEELIFSVTGYDANLLDSLTYMLDQVVPDVDWFRVDPETGEVFVAAIGDTKEPDAEYHLTISVSDGCHSSQSNLMVLVGGLATSPAPQSENAGGGLPIGAIIGAVLGVLLLTSAILIYLCYRKRARRKKDAERLDNNDGADNVEKGKQDGSQDDGQSNNSANSVKDEAKDEGLTNDNANTVKEDVENDVQGSTEANTVKDYAKDGTLRNENDNTVQYTDVTTEAQSDVQDNVPDRSQSDINQGSTATGLQSHSISSIDPFPPEMGGLSTVDVDTPVGIARDLLPPPGPETTLSSVPPLATNYQP